MLQPYRGTARSAAFLHQLVETKEEQGDIACPEQDYPNARTHMSGPFDQSFEFVQQFQRPK